MVAGKGSKMRETDAWAMFEEDVTGEVNHGICVSNLAYYVAKVSGVNSFHFYKILYALKYLITTNKLTSI